MDVCQKDDFQDISCECTEAGSRPVDFLGDHVCTERIAVKDMIEKFDVARKDSSSNSVQQSNSDTKKPQPERTASKKSVKTLSASYEKLPQIQSTKSFYKMDSPKNSLKPKISLENGGTSYQSRTTIAKTSQGVRIITDIFYDPTQGTIEDGIGSRIETDIPPSKILQDFQNKYSSDLD